MRGLPALLLGLVAGSVLALTAVLVLGNGPDEPTLEAPSGMPPHAARRADLVEAITRLDRSVRDLVAKLDRVEGPDSRKEIAPTPTVTSTNAIEAGLAELTAAITELAEDRNAVAQRDGSSRLRAIVRKQPDRVPPDFRKRYENREKARKALLFKTYSARSGSPTG